MTDPASTLTEAVTELTVQIARLSRAVEDTGTMGPDARVFPHPLPLPSIRYSDTINPSHAPQKRLTWPERVRAKRVSVPAAAGWSGAALLLAELLRIVVTHWP